MPRELPQKLSKRQADVLDFIRDFIHMRGMPPTVREIGRKLGIKSSTAHQHLQYLERKGYLERTDLGARSLKLTEPVDRCERCGEVRIKGRIVAGQPEWATEEDMGSVAVAKEVTKGRETYALEVSGDSMIDAGIFDGDVVVVRKQETAGDGDIVVALIEDEATLKTFYKEGRRVRLEPANKKMKPIYVERGGFRIQGKVIAVQRLL